MEVTFKPTKEDYTAFFKYHIFRTNLIGKSVLLFLLAGPLQFEMNKIFHFSNEISFCYPTYILSLFILILILLFLPYIFSVLKLEKKLAVDGKLLDDQKIIIINDGIEVKSGYDDIFWKFSSIKSIGINSRCIYIIMFGKGFYIIPVRFFSNISDAANFYGVLQQEWSKIKASGTYKNPQRLYKWGWLGIIPVYGAISGSILIYRGLVQYKDKMLVLIGAFGIGVTICFYFLMNNYMNSEAYRRGFVTITQSQLNGLVKEIEFYKMQNRAYPDSLQRINDYNKFTPIIDPMTIKGMDKKAAFFHYKKIKDKYTLFSVGIDGFAGTNDDMYPTIAMNDTAKFGLIRDR